MPRFSVEGKFLQQSLTGTQRYAYEIMKEVDLSPCASDFEIVLPEEGNTDLAENFENIQIVRTGNNHGPLWTHLTFYKYCRRNRSTPVCLNNIAPLLSAAVVTIHDVSPLANKTFYSAKYRAYIRLCIFFNCRFSKIIFTDTEFSKSEIERYIPSSQGKISIVPCGWQHMNKVSCDDGALNRYGLEANSYHFALSSLTPNKNLKWIVETARLNPLETFVVAGGINTKVFGKNDIPEAKNVRYIGYVSDGESKALMKNCKSFLFPTFYEGFGIPPMEAMAAGAPSIVVGDIPCMHEVYGDSVLYVDPSEPCKDMGFLLKGQCKEFDSVLDKYSWSTSARIFLRELYGA